MSFLNDGAVAWRRSPPGFDKAVFDVWQSTFAEMARSYFPNEDKILSLDGAKVHLSTAGVLTLLRARVHVVAEPSKMSHLLQALDNRSAFDRYNPRAAGPSAGTRDLSRVPRLVPALQHARADAVHSEGGI